MKKPLNIYFATHDTCNLNCRYCYIKTKSEFEKSDDSIIINSLAEFISKADIEEQPIGSFCLHGTEPTLMEAETIAEIVGMINAHWTKHNLTDYKVAIQTNGLKLNEKYFAKLESHLHSPSMLKIGFSIDPPKQVHDFLRNKSFDTIEKNYQAARNKGFPTGVLSVVSSMTMQYLDEFKSWIKEQLALNAKYGNPYKVKIKFVTGEYELSQSDYEKFAYFLMGNDLLGLCQSFSPGYCIMSGNDCMWFEFDIKGNCYSCNKTYLNGGVFANWQKDSFESIINKRGKLYSKVIEHSDCMNCSFELFCNSGCPADRYKTGSMAGKAHDCTMIRTVLREFDKQNKHITDIINN